MLRVETTTLCSTNITAVWIECKAGIKKPNQKKKKKKSTQKLNILKRRCIFILIKTILFNNFFSRNNFTNTKRTFIYGLSKYPIAIIYESSHFS